MPNPPLEKTLAKQAQKSIMPEWSFCTVREQEASKPIEIGQVLNTEEIGASFAAITDARPSNFPSSRPSRLSTSWVTLMELSNYRQRDGHPYVRLLTVRTPAEGFEVRRLSVNAEH
jgi:hypothetical protein